MNDESPSTSVLQSTQRLATRLWSWLVLFAGMLLYGTSLWLKTKPEWQMFAHALKDFAGMTLGGGLVALLFDWISSRDSELRTRLIIDDSLKRALQPSVERVRALALAGYRWYCYIEPPNASDPHPSYMYQNVRLMYSLPNAPERMKVICAVSNEGGALRAWRDDPERVMQWKIETAGEPLRVTDSSVFSLVEFRLEGVLLMPHQVMVVDVPGGSAKVIEFAVHELLRGKEVRLSIVMRTRMYCEMNGRSVTSTQLFRDVSDAEFTYVVSDQLPLRDLQVITDEVTPLVRGFRSSMEGPVWPQARRQSAFVAFRAPLQDGSAVRFEIYRSQVGASVALPETTSTLPVCGELT